MRFSDLPQYDQQSLDKICDVIIEMPESALSARQIKRILQQENDALIEQGLSREERGVILMRRFQELRGE